jgi:hypothetical protein
VSCSKLIIAKKCALTAPASPLQRQRMIDSLDSKFQFLWTLFTTRVNLVIGAVFRASVTSFCVASHATEAQVERKDDSSQYADVMLPFLLHLKNSLATLLGCSASCTCHSYHGDEGDCDDGEELHLDQRKY